MTSIIVGLVAGRLPVSIAIAINAGTVKVIIIHGPIAILIDPVVAYLCNTGIDIWICINAIIPATASTNVSIIVIIVIKGARDGE